MNNYRNEQVRRSIINTDKNEFKNILKDDELILKLAEFFAIFGDSTRIQIMAILRLGRKNVSEISEALNLSISATSHQLKILKSNDLVRSEREGKFIYYFLSDEHVTSIFDLGLEHLTEK